MVRSLTRCRSCGLPGILAENVDWRPNGTIMLKRLKRIRMVMLDASTLKGLCNATTLEKGLEIFYVEEKNATRYIINKLFSSVICKISRYDAMKKEIMELIENLSLLMGTGRIEVERYVPSQMLVMILKNPLNLHLVTAGIAGIIEEIDKCPYSYSHCDLGDNVFQLILEAADEGAFDKDSFGWLATEPPMDKNVRILDRCNQCGLPLAAGGFRWDELRGVVEAGEEWRRLGFLPGYTLAIMAKMAAGSGAREDGGLLEEAIYSNTLMQLEAGMGDAYSGVDTVSSLGKVGPSSDTWDVLQVRGWGVMEKARIDAKQWRVTIMNPVDKAILAGWLRAIYTIAVGKEPRLSLLQNAFKLQYVLE